MNKEIQDICNFMDDTEEDGTYEFHIGDCIGICYGHASDSSLSGIICLADNQQFDRWSNSRTILLDYSNLCIERNLVGVLKAAISIYSNPLNTETKKSGPKAAFPCS